MKKYLHGRYFPVVVGILFMGLGLILKERSILGMGIGIMGGALYPFSSINLLP